MIVPAPEETDAAYHLRRNSRRIEHDVLMPENVTEPERGNDHKDRRADRHKHMRPQARDLLKTLTLQTDRASQQRRQEKPNYDLFI
ncbi:MAG: hypothetical protein UZ17_ACD001001653 [Acidobacteria bacterium OLB17]|nr:MAG: hypothetical protein UZ17_ACD001001653 [Acidobacteria bacterium OLB17]